jgi:hypothetical protein
MLALEMLNYDTKVEINPRLYAVKQFISHKNNFKNVNYNTIGPKNIFFMVNVWMFVSSVSSEKLKNFSSDDVIGVTKNCVTRARYTKNVKNVLHKSKSVRAVCKF